MAPYAAGTRRRKARLRREVLGSTALLLGLAACALPGGAAAPTSAPAPSTSLADNSSTPSGSDGTSPAATPGTGPSASAPMPGPSQGSCAQLVGRLNLREQVGQLMMVAVGSTGMSEAESRAVSRSHAGSVLLLGQSTTGTVGTADAVRDVRSAAHRPAEVEVLMAADQEGGLVQRLAGPGFSEIPAAVDQAELSDGQLTREAEKWGGQLERAGIDANLAPVADVVPSDLRALNDPIGKLRRGYGPSPVTVAEKVDAFTKGMDRAGIATAVKHFPGLGRVRGNTDFERRVVDATTTRSDRGLRGFATAVDAGVDMVMVSSAFYTRIDPQRQAVFSPTVIEGMIRGDLGFSGVVISDDLSAAAVRDVAAERRAISFVGAGGDLMIVGDPASVLPMAEAVVRRGGRDRAFAQRIEQSAARVLALKDRRGLARC